MKDFDGRRFLTSAGILLALGLAAPLPARAHDIGDGQGCNPAVGDGDDHAHVSVTGGIADETAGTVTFHVICNPCADMDATSHWNTVDGTAIAGQDYQAVSNHFIQLGADEGGASEDHLVVVNLINDTDFEPNESFSLQLFVGPAEPSVLPPCLTFDSSSASFTIDSEDPENTPPTVAANTDPVTVDEGDTASNTGAFSDAQGNATVTLSASIGAIVKNDGAGTWTWSFDTDDGPEDGQVVTITATDDKNAQASDTFTLTVDNVAPDVDAPAISPQPSDEGSAVTAGADFSDPAGSADAPFTCTVDYGDGSGAQAGTVAGFHCTGPSHTYADDGAYTVEICVSDEDGAEGCGDSDHTVDNVAPTIGDTANSAAACGDSGDGTPVEVSADFSDPGFDSAVAGTLEDFDDSTIDWGDGTVEAADVDETPGGAGTPTTGTASGSHVYASGGIYTIVITVKDDDGGTDSVTLTALVSGVGLTPEGLLGVVGTEFKDVVNIQRKGSVIEVQGPFLGPGRVSFPAGDVEALHVATCGGDDQIHVNHDVLAPAILDGGAGDDHVRAGGGPSEILGGDGADHLSGGRADDQIHGGAGDDELAGGPGSNLLDGGTEVDHCNAAQGVNVLVDCEN